MCETEPTHASPDRERGLHGETVNHFLMACSFSSQFWWAFTHPFNPSIFNWLYNVILYFVNFLCLSLQQRPDWSTSHRTGPSSWSMTHWTFLRLTASAEASSAPSSPWTSQRTRREPWSCSGRLVSTHPSGSGIPAEQSPSPWPSLSNASEIPKFYQLIKRSQ